MSNESIKVDARLIFATNKDLFLEIRNDKFRQDLYYRISTLTIEVPPLREHKDDIQLLAEKFVSEFCFDNNFTLKRLSDNAIEKLYSYDFPGNIRELKNIIIKSIVLAKNQDVITEKQILFEKISFDDNIFENTVPLSEKKNIANYYFNPVSALKNDK